MENQVIALEKQRFEYLINAQYDQFAAMCSEDLRYVHSGGTVDDLTAYIKKLKSGFYDYQEMCLDIANIIDMQTYVMVIGDLNAKLLVDGQPRILQNRAVSLWKKEHDQLKFLMYQGTPFGA